MPKKNGFEAVTEIRKIPELADVPIIAISASVTATERQKSIEVGCNHFLPKPVDEVQLQIVISQLLQLEWIFEKSESLSSETSSPNQPKAMTMPPAEELETCLLYTSPSPRDLSTSRMPSSA